MIQFHGTKYLENKNNINVKSLFKPKAVKGVATVQASPIRGNPRVNMRLTQMLPSNDFMLI